MAWSSRHKVLQLDRLDVLIESEHALVDIGEDKATFDVNSQLRPRYCVCGILLLNE